MHPYLYPGLELGPKALAALVAAIPESKLDVPTADERFSVREVVAHLADWEPILRGRIQSAVETPGSTVEAYDEGEIAKAKGYSGWAIEPSMALYAAERAKTIEFVRTITAPEWENAVLHPERGRMTAYDLANMLLGHEIYHLEQVSRMLA